MFRDHEVTVRLDPAAPAVCGDRLALEQVVVNLAANACQAAPGGQVTIGTLLTLFGSRGGDARASDGSTAVPRPMRRWSPRPRRPDLPADSPGALLFVADSGPGVPEGNRERIFDPFFTTKEPGQGTGLGLAIVARTVHESGGVVWVDRAREGGAVFKVFLPLAGGSDASADR
jgi:signal transduction histidine kinase